MQPNTHPCCCTSLPIVADEKEHTEIVQILAEAIIARNAVVDPTAIDVFTAAKAGDAVSIQRCGAAGVVLDLRDEKRWTPLMRAVLWATVGNVCGHSTDGVFLTLSDCVAYKGHADVVKALIKAGAALDAADKDGKTALMLAALSPRAMGAGAGSQARV